MISAAAGLAAPQAATGAFVDGVHVFRLRVYYEDTDAAGIVYYANYLKFAERARSELLRDVGVDQPALVAREGATFAVRACAVEYLRPARLDDLLDIHSRVLAVKPASLRGAQSVRRGDVELARLDLRIAWMTADGKPVRLPAELRAALETTANGKG